MELQVLFAVILKGTSGEKKGLLYRLCLNLFYFKMKNELEKFVSKLNIILFNE